MRRIIKANSNNDLKYTELIKDTNEHDKSKVKNNKDGDVINSDVINLESVSDSKLEYFTE